jgi:hypothetical protein
MLQIAVLKQEGGEDARDPLAGRKNMRNNESLKMQVLPAFSSYEDVLSRPSEESGIPQIEADILAQTRPTSSLQAHTKRISFPAAGVEKNQAIAFYRSCGVYNSILDSVSQNPAHP